MTSFVNVSLKLQTLISQIGQYVFFFKSVGSFALQKLLSFFSSFFSAENISVFGYKDLKHLTSRPLKELVKLTIL